MRAARIENGVVADLWEVPALDCYGDLYTLIEAPAGVGMGAPYVNGEFITPVTPLEVIAAQQAQAARTQRDGLMAACDWTQCSDTPPATAAKWAPYRQALRNVPVQAGFPTDIVWPVSP